MLLIMRYAIVSDIHANLPAWKMVLADLASMGADRIICLGDVVGYGPQPVEVLASVYQHVDALVMGNHDAVVCGKMTPENFNRQARAMIDWSTEKVSRKGKLFLASAALSLKGEGFTCVHGELGLPRAFRYLVNPDDTEPTWEATEDQIVFVGHSHRAGMFVRGASGVPHPLPPEDFILEAGKRYIVNVGSVGYPRDGDPRASYCLYDVAEQVVRFRRVVFDYEALTQAVAAAGLDKETLPMLDQNPLALHKPVREQLEYEPSQNIAQMAQDVIESQDLQRLRKSNRRWRQVALIGILLAALISGVTAAIIVHRNIVSEAVFPATPLPVREAVVPSDLVGNLLPALPDSMTENVLEGWLYRLSRPKMQALTVEHSVKSGPSPCLKLVHKRSARFRLEAPELKLNGVGQGRLRAWVTALRSDDFKGTVTVVAIAEEAAESEGQRIRERNILNFNLLLNRKQTWETNRRIMDIKRPHISSATEGVRFWIEGEFVGTLLLGNLVLRFEE